MKLTPDELRRAYAEATSAGPVEHPGPDVLSRLLGGDVTEAEREAAVAHVAVCSRCADEVRVARPVGDSLSATLAPSRVARPAAWWRPAVLLAAAASILVVAALSLRVGRPAPSTAYRAAPGPGLRSLLPEGARLSRSSPLLRWSGARAGTTFDVVLANERLDVLARFEGVKTTELAVPASALSALPAGAKLVWRVTVVEPDGSRTETAAFVTLVE